MCRLTPWVESVTINMMCAYSSSTYIRTALLIIFKTVNVSLNTAKSHV